MNCLCILRVSINMKNGLIFQNQNAFYNNKLNLNMSKNNECHKLMCKVQICNWIHRCECDPSQIGSYQFNSCHSVLRVDLFDTMK